jgi:two-component system cell cycle sensor histidine kinase/response regulator CckA
MLEAASAVISYVHRRGRFPPLEARLHVIERIWSRPKALMIAIGKCNTTLKQRVHRLLGSRVELIWIRCSELDPVAGEWEWVEQVILDMALRARASLPFGGRLLIESANLELDEFCAQAEGLTAGRYVMFEMTCLRTAASNVPDDVSPMDSLDLSDDIWCHSLLPRSRAVLQSLGGNICEYNEPGRALTLRAFFPSAATVVYSDEEDFSLSNTVPETILLVEDENFVREVASEILEAAGYNVLQARTAKEALSIFEKHGPVKLLLTDVVMPGMNGRDLARKLATLQPNLKTIYMSGYTDNPLIRQDFMSQGVEYIQKPFTMEILTKRVREVMQRVS